MPQFEAVHPRACGEHLLVCNPCVYVGGSSPRLRGTPRQQRRELGIDRFIPAPAGNTAGVSHRNADRTVHPRACGEHLTIVACARNADGSSPRLRGTHLRARRQRRHDRFIPAPAGNTVSLWQCVLAASGSSPRLRGTPRARCQALAKRRFIPAPAGNTTAC